MNWTGAPSDHEPLPIRAMMRHGVHRYRRTKIRRITRATGWATWCAWRMDQDLRDLHVCTRAMSRMRCGACNRGVPYPHAPTLDEMLMSGAL